jgi:hypothetical protein
MEVVTFKTCGKSRQYSLDRRLGRPKKRFGHGGEENKAFLP